ncbi:MAG: Tat pathway signal sequence domain protein, partial [Alphaproteobacteria bacterium]
MRRVLTSLIAVSVLAIALPAAAQMPGQQQQPGQRGQQRQGEDAQEAPRSRAPRIAPLRQRANAGPCPFVKVLYDAARYVELADNRAATANVGFTGEIEGVTAGCSYRDNEPITVQIDMLFNLGRGPQASGDQRTYRYWVALTERNSAVLAKEYFDLPVNFDGSRTASVTEEKTIVIPRKGPEVSGS